MQKYIRAITFAFVAFFVSGCFTQKIDFSSLPGTPQKFSVTSVEVSTTDNRPYVLSGEKTPQWVGLFRNGYGIPFGVHTKSGDPLSQDFTRSIIRYLKDAGISNVTSSTSNDKSIRSVKLTINEFKSDSLINVNFDYDLTLDIYRGDLKLAEERSINHTKLVGSFWNPASAARKAITKETSKILLELFNRPAIQKALTAQQK